MNTPPTCPACGQPLPHPPRKPGPKAKRPNPPTTSVPQRLRERYGDGQPFTAQDAAEQLGESLEVVASSLRRMEDAVRVGTVRAKSGQRVGLWGIVLVP
jgi:hypothetical protein